MRAFIQWLLSKLFPFDAGTIDGKKQKRIDEHCIESSDVVQAQLQVKKEK
jgi:hypothetical protein